VVELHKNLLIAGGRRVQQRTKIRYLNTQFQ
jgi:hypothetical protein